MSQENISSAEMTAYWRSLFPQLSKDTVSVKLATEQGIIKAKEFEKRFSYPLVGRKVSVRAGFILETAKSVLKTGKYDSCVSIASGFSLLTYLIACEVLPELPDTVFVDLDLPYIIEERIKRIKGLPAGTLVTNILDKIKSVASDLEMACKQQKKFKDLFVNCNKPVFIIEGLIYFLSNECVDWITTEILTYTKATVIFDYWPANGTEKSICFKRAIEALKGFIRENVKSFWDRENISQFSKHFLIGNDYSLMSIENKASSEINENPKFTNQDEFFPVHFFVGKR